MLLKELQLPKAMYTLELSPMLVTGDINEPVAKAMGNFEKNPNVNKAFKQHI